MSILTAFLFHYYILYTFFNVVYLQLLLHVKYSIYLVLVLVYMVHGQELVRIELD